MVHKILFDSMGSFIRRRDLHTRNHPRARTKTVTNLLLVNTVPLNLARSMQVQVRETCHDDALVQQLMQTAHPFKSGRKFSTSFIDSIVMLDCSRHVERFHVYILYLLVTNLSLEYFFFITHVQSNSLVMWCLLVNTRKRRLRLRFLLGFLCLNANLTTLW